jgi:general secretion pathway protein E
VQGESGVAVAAAAGRVGSDGTDGGDDTAAAVPSAALAGPAPELGALLLAAGHLAAPALARARVLQRETGERLDSVLLKLGLVAEADLAAALSAALHLPRIGPAQFPAAAVLAERLPAGFLRQMRALPVAADERGVDVAVVDPTDSYVAEAIGYRLKRPVRLHVALASDLDRAFERLYADGRTAQAELAQSAGEKVAALRHDDVERLKDLASDAPVIRLVNRWIEDAAALGASDVHLESTEDALLVRYRIDGVLKPVEQAPPQIQAAVVSRLKIMAKLDIAERRLAQDGRIGLAVKGREIDIRISIIPTVAGESIVLRLLERGNIALDFSSLGLEGDTLTRWLAALERPHGIVLVTGPTGSGKTTTLYASLLRLRKPEVKILTLEDPVEYRLDGINQTQVKPQIGFTFASALRSFLRHDPDIMMVGEIRDVETAKIAVQAALTGHLVLSTLHTNDAASAVTRLIDMGLEDFLLTATINGLAAQRLVRVLCSHCREPYRPEPALVARLGLSAPAGTTLYRARGCSHCGNTGYRGRTAISEVLVMSEGIRRLVMAKATAQQLQQAAAAEGMETMYQHGLRKCLAGVTSVEEVVRVTRDI